MLTRLREKLFAPTRQTIYEVMRARKLRRLTEIWDHAPLSKGEKAEVKNTLQKEFLNMERTFGTHPDNHHVPSGSRFLP